MVVAFYFRLHLAYFPRPVVAIFARPEQRHKRFRFAKTLVYKQFICLCAVKCPTDTKAGAFAPCKHFAQQNLGGGGIHFHRAF